MTRILRRVVAPAVALVVLAAVFAIGVLPTRSYLDKREQIAAAEAQLDDLEQANAAAEAHVEALRTDAEVERLAREQHGLAKPGEEVYRVLPPPEEPVVVPDAWPFERLTADLGA